jgi:hypothetical protein
MSTVLHRLANYNVILQGATSVSGIRIGSTSQQNVCIIFLFRILSIPNAMNQSCPLIDLIQLVEVRTKPSCSPEIST